MTGTQRQKRKLIGHQNEAMNCILNKNASIELSNSRKIIDTRNRIIHGYDTVSDEVIWGTQINHLSPLKQEVEALLKQIASFEQVSLPFFPTDPQFFAFAQDTNLIPK